MPGEEALYIVSVKGDGIAVEKNVTADVARQVMNVIMGGVAVVPAALMGKSAIAVGVADGTTRRLSLREFLEDSQAKRNPDKITAMAEYLFTFEDQELFTREDIKGRFRLAGEAAPANFPRDFTWAVKNGWIAEEPKSPGSFYVTQKGRNAIRDKFSSEVKKTTSQPTARRRTRRVRAATPETAT